ncbi:hypothetical protein MOD76_19870 [Bacillus spizizenii]|nr:hypothetical protein [Bacillus spizizenii]MCY8907084.1 hypothetical protein [Bacillus spizizenii]
MKSPHSKDCSIQDELNPLKSFAKKIEVSTMESASNAALELGNLTDGLVSAVDILNQSR